jgi:hypothetical protein
MSPKLSKVLQRMNASIFFNLKIIHSVPYGLDSINGGDTKSLFIGRMLGVLSDHMASYISAKMRIRFSTVHNRMLGTY